MSVESRRRLGEGVRGIEGMARRLPWFWLIVNTLPRKLQAPEQACRGARVPCGRQNY